jgi:thioredoxin reductase
MNDSIADALVVGAGPYGLSTAAHLRHHGLDVRIIGMPMEFWDNCVPPGMFLKSEPFASNLGAPVAGARFTDLHPGWRTGRPIPVSTFVDYGRWFAGHLVPYTEDAQVLRIEQTRDRYAVTLSTGEVAQARTVVVAVGVGPFAYTPATLATLPAELGTHSVAHRDLDDFKGQEVAVVGAGQSALETAVLLADAGAHPQVITRTPELAWNSVPVSSPSIVNRLLRGPHSGLGRGYRTWLWSEHPWATRLLPDTTRRHLVRTTLGPAGAWWLRERLDHRVEVLTGRVIIAAAEEGGKAVLTTAGHEGNRWEHRVDHVIAATGYVPDLDRITVLAPELRAKLRTKLRTPVLGKNFQSSEPGLYFTGLTAAPSFGPVMRFVHGADFTARRVAEHIAAGLGARPGEDRTTAQDAEGSQAASKIPVKPS